MISPRHIAVALFAANGAAVLAIWWAGLPSSPLTGAAGVANAVGRLTALVGTYLLLVQLVLRTHVPWLVAAFGKEALRTAHTWNAYAATGLIAIHVVTQLAGYALQDRVNALAEIGLMVAHLDGMIAAIAGFVLLAGLTVVSLDPLRHRIAWPTWRALHLFMYPAVLLAVPHEIATGSDFLDAPLAVAYWAALEVAVLAILLVVRIPPMLRAVGVVERPNAAVAGVGAFVVAAYLVGSVRFAPALPPRAVPQDGTADHGSELPPPAAATALTSAPPARSVAIEGDPVETPYGIAQVRVILSSGRIADVEPVLMPSATRRSRTISYSAEPWLRRRAIAAQSAEFDVLSGATYTSQGYMASLGTALRAAGLERP